MQKKGTQAFYKSKGLNEMFQRLKWCILHFFSTNTFGDTAMIELVYLNILCCNFVISYKTKNGKM